MAAPKLTEEQRNALIGWLAAEYTEPAIRRFLADRGWPAITGQSIQHYRNRYGSLIETVREQRRSAALNTGLALKEERVGRLKQHADELDEIKWVPDEKGRLWNEKGWRETLDDIAREMGHRRTGVDLNVGRYSDQELIARTQAAFDRGAASAAAGDGAPGTDTPDDGL